MRGCNPCAPSRSKPHRDYDLNAPANPPKRGPAASNKASPRPFAIKLVNDYPDPFSSKAAIEIPGFSLRRFGSKDHRAKWGYRKPLKTYEEYRDLARQRGRIDFVDPDFKPDFSSIFERDASHQHTERGKLTLDSLKSRFKVDTENDIERRVVWKRPLELDPSAEFVLVRGIRDKKKSFVPEDPDREAHRYDVLQGGLGDCWLIGAMAAMTRNQDTFERVVMGKEQGFKHPANKYCGIFKFRLWIDGFWVEVFVDDLLPYSIDREGKPAYPLFAKPSVRGEYWIPLLEKAFAKICGSYASLYYGSSSWAMQHFTGGFRSTVGMNLQKETPAFTELLGYWKNGDYMFAGINTAVAEQEREDQAEQLKSVCLTRSHAYTITGVAIVKQKNGLKHECIRIRDPVGTATECEWNKEFSDSDVIWKEIDEMHRRKSLDHKIDEGDGEAWMRYTDFLRWFNRMEICHIALDPWIDSASTRGDSSWRSFVYHGIWTKGMPDPSQKPSLVYDYPQYEVTITEANKDTNSATLVACLSQSLHSHGELVGSGKNMALLLVKPPATDRSFPLPSNPWKVNTYQEMAREEFSTHERGYSWKLPVGRYVIIPYRNKNDEDRNYLLRIFCQTGSVARDVADVFFNLNDFENVYEEELLTKELPEDIKKIFVSDGVDRPAFKSVFDAFFKPSFPFPGFSASTRLSMFLFADLDDNYVITSKEFKSIWFRLQEWEAVFGRFSRKDRQHGYIFGPELKSVLQECGYGIKNTLLKVLKDCGSEDDETITFDAFVSCTIRLLRLRREFCIRTGLNKGNYSSVRNEQEEARPGVETTLYEHHMIKNMELMGK